jgi:histidyl-tRNA synthetase
MSKQTYLLSFNEVSGAEANEYAEELREALLDATTEIAVQRQRENPLAQDLGATLVLIMGTPAVVAVVHAISNWLQKRRSASLTIVTAEKKIVAENLTNKEAAQLLQLFLTQSAEHKEPGP